MASARRMRQVRLRRCQSLQPIHSLVLQECELSVYKSVPAPRQLSGAAEGPADTARGTEHPLSGSEPVLTDLPGRLTSVTAQVTRAPAPDAWQGGSGTTISPAATISGGEADPGAVAANGRLVKKYHHLRDMISSRFSRSEEADGRGVPLTPAAEHGRPPAAGAVSAARRAPLRSSVRSLAAEEVPAAAGDRQLWSADGPAPGRVASLGARYTSAAPSALSTPQHPLANGSPAGEPQYLGYTVPGREYRPQGYHEPPEYRHTSAAAGPATSGSYTATEQGGGPAQRPADPRPQRPPAGFTGTSSVTARTTGFPTHQPRPPPPPTQPRPPPPAYGTRLPPPGHYLSRQGSQGRLQADSQFGPARSAVSSTGTARPAVPSGPPPDPAPADRRSGDGLRGQPSADPPQVALKPPLDTSLDSDGRAGVKIDGQRPGQATDNEQEWADTETELSHILEPGSRRPDLTPAPSGVPSTPPLPALHGSPPRSPAETPRLGSRSPCRPSGGPSQPDLLEDAAAPGGHSLPGRLGSGLAARNRQGRSQSQSRGWASSNKELPTAGRDARERSRHSAITRVGSLGVLGQANDSGGDLASLDLESALDQTSDQSTDDSTVLEAVVDGPTVRRQLQSLETMYSEVLRLLGGQKRAQPGRPARVSAGRLRPGSSISSLPSSIGGKPSRDRRRDDRKQLRDSRGINKRFQRLESHVVTLARSVAHLSSEMRTQHLMFQEMESIRAELAQLRQGSAGGPRAGAELGGLRPAGVSLTHPPRVRKLTRFFGDEPPLLRIFLNQLGYEKYAPLFERERIGMLELPYMTEERLQKLGVPIGPRLRILHEAQLSIKNDNPNVYIL